jgi:lipid-A-disaccharide synthase-like uncharacterized protein
MNLGHNWHFGFWQVIGLVGQSLFFSRFLVQWYVSERERRSVVPISFWWLSLVGSSIVLVYAVVIQDLVFTLAQSCGFVVYIRNLVLIKREQRAKTPIAGG